MFSDRVAPKISSSQPGGTRRSAPSAKPMYQSGWVPAETGDGSYGPYTQIGLIVKSGGDEDQHTEDDEEEPAGLRREHRHDRHADDVVVGARRGRRTGCAC